MVAVTLPDGKQYHYDKSVTVKEIATGIGPSLARSAIAAKVNDKLVDLAYYITEDAKVQIITERDDEGLEIIRHSTSHLMAQAVKQLFPEVQVTIGPVIEDGFYYDFAYKTPFTQADLLRIEQQMQMLVKQDIPIQRTEVSREVGIEQFTAMGEHYKAEILTDIPEGETLSLYQQNDFTDLCRGPHVPSTGKLKAFKLMKLAGAYWRGDAKNEMLQRIYGTAWPDKKSLKQYLHRLEEAEKRDHRKLGKTLDLFHIQEEASGMIFWHDNGWRLYRHIEDYIRDILKQHHYQEVKTPQVVDRVLWEKSGHWDKFGDMIFSTHSENRDYAIKPMNCPCHVQIFNQGVKSYRDLPLRMAEFGSCHRNEPSGTLHGLMRLRGFTQDDAHIFCTEDQIQQEVASFIKLLQTVYADFGFDDILIKLSTRPEKRVGSDAVWDKSEQALALALDTKGLDWQYLPGEGAFYGPKIEFSLKDCLGRIWQCGTIQVDFSMPERLEANYIDAEGNKQVPVMLHRAVLGSLERFIGILIEQYAGALPTWLAPQQVAVMAINESQAEYVRQTTKTLLSHGIRVEHDLRNEKIGFKIREHTLRRVPYLIIIGDREVKDNSVAVRTRAGKDLGVMSLATFIDTIARDVNQRGRKKIED
ncbi:MAG TPA: threonine--tRNA ligase [Gammaproteobacteria bacterium]|nr:threonine--tRNA ligase [Gammaproteobacteria bacterium]